MTNGGVKGVLRSSSGDNTNDDNDQDMFAKEETIDENNNEESMMNNETDEEEESVQAQIKPDGKFESEILEFRYVPMGKKQQKLDLI